MTKLETYICQSDIYTTTNTFICLFVFVFFFFLFFFLFCFVFCLFVCLFVCFCFFFVISFKDLSGLVQVENCPKGTRLPRNCETCPIGFYSDKEGLWKDCLPCKVGETTLAEDATKCVGKLHTTQHLLSITTLNSRKWFHGNLNLGCLLQICNVIAIDKL